MTNVLVCWEDRFHEPLHRSLRRALRHRGLTSPRLYSVGCQGNGGFVPYIERSWHVAVQHGLPKSDGPIHHLVCVADADRAHECCAVDNPTVVAGTTTAWLAQANERWTAKLRAVATIAPERVHGRFLRWSQESLLIAAHDVDQALAALGCRDLVRVKKHLQACSPSPLSTPDADFVDCFRKPGRCLEDMLKAAGATASRKGAISRDDAIEAASTHAIARLCARVPELTTLAHLVSALPAE